MNIDFEIGEYIEVWPTPKSYKFIPNYECRMRVSYSGKLAWDILS